MKLYISALSIAILCMSACTVTHQATSERDLSAAAELNRQLGLAYLQQNDWLRAEDRLMLALQQDPQSASILNALAYIFQNTQRISLAQFYYEKAQRLQPHDPELLNHFGAFLCQQGDYTQGIAILQQARRYSRLPTLQLIDENLYICHLLAKDKRAVKELAPSLGID